MRYLVVLMLLAGCSLNQLRGYNAAAQVALSERVIEGAKKIRAIVEAEKAEEPVNESPDDDAAPTHSGLFEN